MVGAMLPYTPLHHLLLREIGRPVVATSGNLSEEPLCFDNDDALRRLGEIADLFLVHDRPIARPVDDSVVRFARGRELPLRRARGYAPLPVLVSENLAPTLAVGGHLKNTVALGLGRHVFLSPHIGDLEGRPSMEAFERNVSCLQSIWEVRDPRLARDLHPDYLSTRWAEERSSDALAVQHHFAHVVACLADNEAEGPVLGLSWDGTGYGPDGTIWGGEFLRATRSGYERLARVRTFPLPGGDAAIREPRRSALGLLYEAYGEDGTREQALADFDGWRPEVTALIEAADRHYRWALHDRPPLPQWHRGRIGLLGDACHPVLPFLAQGAAMAIEDGWVLSAMLAQHVPADVALASYARARRARVTRVYEGARANAALFHLPRTPWRGGTRLALKLGGLALPGVARSRLDWLYGEDVTRRFPIGR